MNDLITVIVPVYNVRSYLQMCVDSILRQDYTNLEVILIDDGSSDGSGDICDEYATKDSRVHVIHKENGGLSDARNAAMNTAHGRYITFIDSDDTVHPKYVSSMYQVMIEEQVDLVQCGETRDEKMLSTIEPHVIKYSAQQAFKRLLLVQDVKEMACGKLYRADIMLRYRYPVGKIYEDTLTTYKVILSCTQIALTEKRLYFYRQRPGSIMNDKFSERRLQVLDVIDEMKAFLGSTYTAYRNELEYYAFRRHLWIYNDMLTQTDNREFSEQKKYIYRCLKQFNLFNPYVRANRKYFLLLLLLKAHRSAYDWAIKKLRGAN